jgi:hypothetical protein
MALLDWFTGIDSEEEQARGDSLDAQLKSLELDYQRRHADQMTQKDIEIRNAEFEAHQRAGRVDNVEQEVNDAFSDELDAQTTGFRGAVGSVVSFPFKLIPWQIWLAAAFALFFWLGGPALLKGKFAKL